LALGFLAFLHNRNVLEELNEKNHPRPIKAKNGVLM
jgi:hypothetical protein